MDCPAFSGSCTKLNQKPTRLVPSGYCFTDQLFWLSPYQEAQRCRLPVLKCSESAGTAEAHKEEPDHQQPVVIFGCHMNISEMADDAENSDKETADPSKIHELPSCTKYNLMSARSMPNRGTGPACVHNYLFVPGILVTAYYNWLCCSNFIESKIGRAHV